MEVHRAVRPDRVLIIALTVGFASLAALVMHVRHIAKISLLAYYVGVCATVAFSIPIVIWTMRAAGSGQRFRRAILSTTVAGALVSEAITVTIILVLPADRISLSVAVLHAQWMLLAVPLGAVPALLGCVALLAATRVIETRYAAPSRDVVSRIAVPMLSVAGFTAAAATLLLDPVEALVVYYGAWVALVGLAVVVREDVDRLRWLGRIFAGKDPEHVLDACAADEAGVQKYVELAYAGSLVRRRVTPSTYRAPARGEACAVLGFTEGETKRPILCRIAGATLSACGIVGLAAIAFAIHL